MLLQNKINIFNDGSVEVVADTPPPPPVVGDGKRYGIVKGNFEPWNSEDGTPQTVVVIVAPVSDSPSYIGKAHTQPVGQEWWDHLELVNDANGFKYARSVRDWWVNRDYFKGPTWPDPEKVFDPVAMAESIIAPLGFISIIGENSLTYEIEAYPYDVTGLNPQVDNWENLPYLWGKVQAMNVLGQVFNVKSGWDCFLPYRKRGRAYIDKTRVELFPALPFGDIIDYKLRGCNVYGITADGSQVPLREVTKFGGLKEYRGFALATKPVIPPEWFK